MDSNLGLRTTLVATVAAGIGAATTYLVSRKQLEARYRQLAAQEIAEAREYYARRFKADDFEDPETARDVLVGAADAVLSYQGTEPVGHMPRCGVVNSNGDVVESNIFLDGRPLGEVAAEFDYDAEVKLRTPDRPYIITHDEFMENDPDHQQPSLTYYAGDQILADEKDEPIEDADNVVGLANLERFGHGSNDSRMVYVRNEGLGMDFEIAWSPGSYAEEVAALGADDPPRHHRRDGE